MGSRRNKFRPKKCRLRLNARGRAGRPIEKKHEHNHTDSINALRAMNTSYLQRESGNGGGGGKGVGVSVFVTPSGRSIVLDLFQVICIAPGTMTGRGGPLFFV